MSTLPTVCRLTERFNRVGVYHEDSYNLSAPYYLLTGRKGTSIYSEGDAQIVVCKHPHVDDRLMVFPEIGGDGTLTFKVLNSLDTPCNGIQLSRYTDDDFARLESAGQRFKQGKKFIFTERDENVMDWKYPVHILNTESVGHLHGISFDKLRNKYNKASQNLSVIDFSSEKALPAMRASLMFWVGSMIYGGKETGHDLMDFYNLLFKMVDASPASFDGFAVLQNGEPSGFTIWDNTTPDIANGLAGLSRQSIPGMSEFQTVTACKKLHEKGIKYYNIGGSETEGLNQYKLKYRPEKSIKIKSYDVNSNSFLTGVKYEHIDMRL